MRAFERFLQYAAIHTRSSEDSDASPSTARQCDLSRLRVEELLALGVSDARVDDHCYVYGSLPATPGCEAAPALGFIAHLDTADFCGEHVSPRLIPDYDGGEVVLGSSGRTLSPADFPHLAALKGRTLIVTDGTTLLGADDKAGIAEILTCLEQLQASGAPHGKLCVAFTPDEEVGRGTEHFDRAAFGARFAYTVDGGPEGQIQYENFNAASAAFTIRGFDIHTGDAKDKMINAMLVACQINGMLPAAETPRATEGYAGFYHLNRLEGNVERAELTYLIRDHDAGGFAARKATLEQIAKTLNEVYGDGTVTLAIRDQYRNMAQGIAPHMHLIDHAVAAAKAAGAEPQIEPIRGGTDGADLTWAGLPCPNLGTGGYAYHGPYEHITAEAMDTVTAMLRAIVAAYAAETL